MSAIAIAVIEWLLEKGLVDLEGAIGSWYQNYQKQKALKSTQVAVDAAEKSGNEQAIEQAGTNDLNNLGG